MTQIRSPKTIDKKIDQLITGDFLLESFVR